MPIRYQSASSLTAAQMYAAPEDLGALVWLRWSASDLPDGPVASWVDSAGGVAATQADPLRRPVKSGSAVQFRNSVLEFPYQPHAHYAHRALLMIFRADVAKGNAEGSIFSVNGISGSTGMRQPAVTYTRAGNIVSPQFRSSTGYNGVSLAGGDGQWHVLLSRVVDGKHYASIDGGTEQVVGDGRARVKFNGSPNGLIGEASTIELDIREIIILQDELTAANAARLIGWAAWEAGIVDKLPAAHPYKLARPTMHPDFAQPEQIEQTPEQWSRFRETLTNEPKFKRLQGSAPDLTGYQLVFEDHFTTNTVGAEDATPESANWFAPVHTAATGSATHAASQITQSGSELKITMELNNGWKSGVFCSVNLDGRGNTWSGGYFEFRAKASAPGVFGAWPAFWLKTVNHFFRLHESYVELDVYEGYSSSGTQHHLAMHNWPGKRPMQGRLTNNRHVGNIDGINPANGFDTAVNLFDDDYHTYGCLVGDTWTAFYFDDQEIGRFPTPPELKQPLYILVDLALFPNEAGQATGVYSLTLDWIRVYQRP